MPSRHDIAHRNPLPSPKTTQFLSATHHRNIMLPLASSGGGVLAFFMLIIVLCRKLSRQKTAPADKFPNRLSYKLLRRATSSFAASNLLGRGGFGSVYRGFHPSLNHIAVKVMDAGSLQGEREFQNELFFAQKINHCANVVVAMGFSYDRRRRRILLVYELMQNGNLQDALLHRKCAELMEWRKRFSIAIEIATGIRYLHGFDPPIIHGDIKPSNILLNQNFVAKIGDFGLSRLKSEGLDEVLVDLSSELEGKKKLELDKNRGDGKDDCGSALEETESVIITGMGELNIGTSQSPGGPCLPRVQVAIAVSPETSMASPDVVESMATKEIETVLGFRASPTAASEGNFDKGSIDSERGEVFTCARIGNGEEKRNVSRRDWWWRQDNGDSNGTEIKKDYVMDWIGTEIKKERPNSSWIGATSGIGKPLRKKNRKRLDWWRKDAKKEKRRPAREWWKEEFCEELAKKKKKKKKMDHDLDLPIEENSWPKEDDLYNVDANKKKGRTKSGSMDWWLDGLSGELWKTKQHHTSFDSISGGGIGSTPSMRGTVCYIAPEFNTGEIVSEKCDVYSYGVLLLVLIAGRRPLQVTGSPMPEFQRANLISWARHLSRSGRLLDLVDSCIRCMDEEEALLCLTVALLCLQKCPSRRPSMEQVVGYLCGEIKRPELPVEFSPSPPSRFPSKSHKKARR